MYSHTQESNAWIFLLIIGIWCTVQFIVFFIILPVIGEYWGFGIALLFVSGMGYVYTSWYYKRLSIEECESYDGKYLKVFFPAIRKRNIPCLSKRALERGISIPYHNINHFMIYHKEPGSCCFTGAFAGGCCSDPVPVYWNINERQLCGFDRHWNPKQEIIEFHLKEPITFGDCGWWNDCQCCGSWCDCVRHSHTLRVSTDDVSGLMEVLNQRGIKGKEIGVLLNVASANSKSLDQNDPRPSLLNADAIDDDAQHWREHEERGGANVKMNIEESTSGSKDSKDAVQVEMDAPCKWRSPVEDEENHWRRKEVESVRSSSELDDIQIR